MNFAEVNFKDFRNEICDALAAITEKYNCEVSIGNIKYDSTSADLTLYFKCKGENGESAEEIAFRESCDKYGFTPSDYQKAVILNGKKYSFIGFNPRARKNHCIIKDTNGVQYVASIPTILNGMVRKEEDK